jgi:protein-S-isoprenylcysteine O-methyltransferase Ste14
VGFAVYGLHRDERYGSAEGTLLATGVVHALVTAAMFAWIHAMQGGHYDSQTVPPYHSNIRHPGYLGYVCAISGIGIAMSRRRLQLSAWLLATIALLEIITLGTRGPSMPGGWPC